MKIAFYQNNTSIDKLSAMNKMYNKKSFRIMSKFSTNDVI